jgi:hypothetical protein
MDNNAAHAKAQGNQKYKFLISFLKPSMILNIPMDNIQVIGPFHWTGGVGW